MKEKTLDTLIGILVFILLFDGIIMVSCVTYSMVKDQVSETIISHKLHKNHMY